MDNLITVARDNTKVVISIETALANDCAGTKIATIPFSWECGHPYLADALARYIDDRLGRAIECARCAEYNKGWADAKAHSKKRTSFSDWL